MSEGMQISVGTTLGGYELTALVGEGGMGRVFKARDLKLKRDVAIKVLPDALATDVERLARLRREAELLASINHPGIATIHDLEEIGDSRFLVLEFIHGETLADRLKRGPIALDESLRLALQIAEALEAAHSKGVIHRDLKPANIKITPEGKIKVLDFGLAKSSALEIETDPHDAPTIGAAATRQGVIAGTPAYMSPEQASGDTVTRLTDNWAFGCLLYEMLCGAPPFKGDTISALFTAIHRVDPDWKTLPIGTPLPLRLLLGRCLQKDHHFRLQYIADARVEIEQLRNETLPASVENAEPARRTPSLMVAATFLILVAVLSVPAFLYFRTPAPIRQYVQFEIPFQSNVPTLKISPDGEQIAYASPINPGGETVIWIRSMNSVTPRMLPGTEGANLFSWSWDSRFIVFREGRGGDDSVGKLKKMNVSTGAAQVIAENASASAFPIWGRSDIIVFGGKGMLRKVSASGGDATDATTMDKASGETIHMWPAFLPDGRHFLYLAVNVGNGSDHGTIYVGSIDPNEPRIRLMDSDSMALYANPGYLLFGSGNALMARPFDAKHYRFTGDAVTVTDSVQFTPTGRLVADVSDNGALIYRSKGQPAAAPFTWYERNGSVAGTTCPIALGTPKTAWRLAPDNKHVALYSLADVDIWLCDLERNQPLRLTNDSYWDRQPIWSSNGSNVVFQSYRSRGNTDSALYEKSADGATAEHLLLAAEPATHVVPLDWSRDGNWMVFSKQKVQPGSQTQANRDLWMLPTGGDRKPSPYLASAFDEYQASISPDGRFVAYTSNQNGRNGEYDVIVQPFPDPSRGLWKISTNGGCCPRWKRDGTELYYTDADRHIIAVPVKTTPTFSPGRPVTLSITVPGSAEGYQYDVTSDGQRFLLAGQPPTPTENPNRSRPITVILNWSLGLKHQ